MENMEVVIDQKQYHAGALHKITQNGGSIKFPNSPFGVRVRGTGGMYLSLELFVVETGRRYEGHITPSKPKPASPAPIVTEETDEIEM